MGMSGPLYSLLKDVSLELMRHSRLQDLLPDIVRRAQEFVGADLAYMALRDEYEDVMRVAFSRSARRLCYPAGRRNQRTSVGNRPNRCDGRLQSLLFPFAGALLG